MSDRHRELVETKEFTEQFDGIVTRYSRSVIVPILTGLLDGISKRPSAFPKVTWNTRLAKSDTLGATIPCFKIVFQIENVDKDSERVLLLWIEEEREPHEFSGLLT